MESIDLVSAGVSMVSGAPIVVEQWSERLKTHAGIKVFLSHGQSDPILPFAASGWTLQLLESGKAQVQYETHPGGHDIGGAAILMKLCQFWASLV